MKEYKDRHDKPLAEEYRWGNRLEEASHLYSVSHSDPGQGFLAGAQYCVDVIEGMLEGYKKNGSEETVTALSNLLVYIRGKNEQN